MKRLLICFYIVFQSTLVFSHVVVVGATNQQDSYLHHILNDDDLILIDRVVGSDFMLDFSHPIENIQEIQAVANNITNVVFEQLPFFVITQASINNAFNLLVAGGTLSMNLPVRLNEVNLNLYHHMIDREFNIQGQRWGMYYNSYFMNNQLLNQPIPIGELPNNQILKTIMTHFLNQQGINVDELDINVIDFIQQENIWEKNRDPMPHNKLILIRKQ